MSAVVKNDNFEQNSWSGQYFWKSLNFHPQHVRRGQKRQFLSKILDRDNIFLKIEIFILDMSTVVKNDNFE